MKILSLMTGALFLASSSAMANQPLTIEVTRNVPVSANKASHQLKGMLYHADIMQKPFLIRHGERFTVVKKGLEGGCTIRVRGQDYEISSCPWQEGFRDHQADLFKIVKR